MTEPQIILTGAILFAAWREYPRREVTRCKPKRSYTEAKSAGDEAFPIEVETLLAGENPQGISSSAV